MASQLSPAEIPRLYHELAQLGAAAEGHWRRWRHGKLSPEALLALAADTSRQEPRLLWVLVDLLARRYDQFDPLRLRRAAEAARWPAALAVALEFARAARPSQELSDVADFICRRLPKARGEQFFLSARAFGGEQARRDAQELLAEYKRWGYLSREVPVAKELGAVGAGTMEPAERMNLLRRLAERQRSVTLRDYLTALRGRTSRRQAGRDLAEAPFLRRKGSTRGARYVWSEGRAPTPATAPQAQPRPRPQHRPPSRGTNRQTH